MVQLIGKPLRRRQFRTSPRRRGAQALLVSLLILIGLGVAFEFATSFKPPDGSEIYFTSDLKANRSGDRLRLQVGKSWISGEPGLFLVYLSGDSEILGSRHGVLVGNLARQPMRDLFDLFVVSVPWSVSRWFLKKRLRWNLRDYSERIEPDQLLEAAAFQRATGSSETMFFEPFFEIVALHAAVDFLQSERREPIFQSTAFAIWGTRSRGKEMIVGKNMDFCPGMGFENSRVLFVVHSKGRVPFASLGWPGLLGAFTGVNAKKIFVSLAMSRTEHSLERGEPALLIVRRILERATSIEEAFLIAKESRKMSSFSLLLADGKRKRAVVGEFTTRRSFLRHPTSDWIAATNHFLHRNMRIDANNDWVERYTPSGIRYGRLQQLLDQPSAAIDPQAAAEILRDKKRLDGISLPLGHRGAIDSLRGCHGLIVNLDSMVAWVFDPPGLLGTARAILLGPLLGLEDASDNATDIAPDPISASEELLLFNFAMKKLEYARFLDAEKVQKKAIEAAMQAVSATPDLPLVQLFLADLYWKQGLPRSSVPHYRKALDNQPPFLREAEKAMARLREPR